MFLLSRNDKSAAAKVLIFCESKSMRPIKLTGNFCLLTMNQSEMPMHRAFCVNKVFLTVWRHKLNLSFCRIYKHLYISRLQYFLR